MGILFTWKINQVKMCAKIEFAFLEVLNKSFRKVVDVFIAQALLCMGKRFDFMRFSKVHDAHAVVNALCDTWFRYYKL